MVLEEEHNSMSMSLSLMKKRRFLPLFVTQFLNAFNDNFFKIALCNGKASAAFYCSILPSVRCKFVAHE